jgi:hypothetical protein
MYKLSLLRSFTRPHISVCVFFEGQVVEVLVKVVRVVKDIPLRLIPLELDAEDSLRWLIILDLIDGVSADYTTWAQIETGEYDENGRETQTRIAQEYKLTWTKWA